MSSNEQDYLPRHKPRQPVAGTTSPNRRSPKKLSRKAQFIRNARLAQMIKPSSEEMRQRELAWDNRFTYEPPRISNKHPPRTMAEPSLSPNRAALQRQKELKIRNERTQYGKKHGTRRMVTPRRPGSERRLAPLGSPTKRSEHTNTLVKREEKLRLKVFKAIDDRETLIYQLNALILCTPVQDPLLIPSRPAEAAPTKARDEQYRRRVAPAPLESASKRKVGSGAMLNNTREATRMAQALAEELQVKGIQVVEAIVEWMLEAGRELPRPPPFLWRGQNYFVKMYNDLDFAGPELRARGVDLPCFSLENPLVLRPGQKLERVLTAQSIIAEMLELTKQRENNNDYTAEPKSFETLSNADMTVVDDHSKEKITSSSRQEEILITGEYVLNENEDQDQMYQSRIPGCASNENLTGRGNFHLSAANDSLTTAATSSLHDKKTESTLKSSGNGNLNKRREDIKILQAEMTGNEEDEICKVQDAKLKVTTPIPSTSHTEVYDDGFESDDYSSEKMDSLSARSSVTATSNKQTARPRLPEEERHGNGSDERNIHEKEVELNLKGDESVVQIPLHATHRSELYDDQFERSEEEKSEHGHDNEEPDSSMNENEPLVQTPPHASHRSETYDAQYERSDDGGNHHDCDDGEADLEIIGNESVVQTPLQPTHRSELYDDQFERSDEEKREHDSDDGKASLGLNEDELKTQTPLQSTYRSEVYNDKFERSDEEQSEPDQNDTEAGSSLNDIKPESKTPSQPIEPNEIFQDAPGNASYRLDTPFSGRSTPMSAVTANQDKVTDAPLTDEENDEKYYSDQSDDVNTQEPVYTADKSLPVTNRSEVYDDGFESEEEAESEVTSIVPPEAATHEAIALSRIEDEQKAEDDANVANASYESDSKEDVESVEHVPTEHSSYSDERDHTRLSEMSHPAHASTLDAPSMIVEDKEEGIEIMESEQDEHVEQSIFENNLMSTRSESNNVNLDEENRVNVNSAARFEAGAGQIGQEEGLDIQNSGKRSDSLSPKSERLQSDLEVQEPSTADTRPHSAANTHEEENADYAESFEEDNNDVLSTRSEDGNTQPSSNLPPKDVDSNSDETYNVEKESAIQVQESDENPMKQLIDLMNKLSPSSNIAEDFVTDLDTMRHWKSRHEIGQCLQSNGDLSDTLQGSFIWSLFSLDLDDNSSLSKMLFDDAARRISFTQAAWRECAEVLDIGCSYVAKEIVSRLRDMTSLVSELHMEDLETKTLFTLHESMHKSTLEVLLRTAKLMASLYAVDKTLDESRDTSQLTSHGLTRLVYLYYPYLTNEPRNKLAEDWKLIKHIVAPLVGDLDDMKFLLDPACRALMLVADMKVVTETNSEGEVSLNRKILCDRSNALSSSIESVVEAFGSTTLTTGLVTLSPTFVCEENVKESDDNDGKSRRRIKEWFEIIATCVSTEWTEAKLELDARNTIKIEDGHLTIKDNTLQSGWKVEWKDSQDNACECVLKAKDGDRWLLDASSATQELPVSHVHFMKPQHAYLRPTQTSDWYWLNPDTATNDANERALWFIGWWIAQAVTHHTTVDISLPNLFFDMLLDENVEIGMREAEEFDYQLAKSWKSLHDMDDKDVQQMLLGSGLNADMSVSDYCRYQIDMKFGTRDNLSWQFRQLRNGFHSVISTTALRQASMSAKDLQFVLCGTTKYTMDEDFAFDHIFQLSLDPAFVQSPLHDAFWHVVKGFTPKRKRQLVQFITGTLTLPIPGTEFLRVDLLKTPEDTDSLLDVLPRAQPITNALAVPNYWHAMLQSAGPIHQEVDEDMKLELQSTLRHNVVLAVDTWKHICVESEVEHEGTLSHILPHGYALDRPLPMSDTDAIQSTTAETALYEDYEPPRTPRPESINVEDIYEEDGDWD